MGSGETEFLYPPPPKLILLWPFEDSDLGKSFGVKIRSFSHLAGRPHGMLDFAALLSSTLVQPLHTATMKIGNSLNNILIGHRELNF